MTSDPMFVMSMYLNKTDLYEAKAKYYMEKSEKLTAEIKRLREELDDVTSYVGEEVM